MTIEPLGVEGPDLLALNVFSEARGELDDGRAAVALVTLNRVRLRYESDGSIEGAVLWPNAFSWTEFAMVDGRYQRVALGRDEQAAHVRACFEAAERSPEWAACKAIAERVQAGVYDTPNFRLLTDKTVLYFNPALCKAPYWADPHKLVAKIGHQWFFHA